MLPIENVPAPDPVESAVAERRALVRYASTLDASCKTRSSFPGGVWPGKVANISAGGIGVWLRHRFRPGTPLSIELKAPSGQVLRVLDARVIHATPAVVDCHSCWLIGCAFHKNLSEDELRTLIE